MARFNRLHTVNEQEEQITTRGNGQICPRGPPVASARALREDVRADHPFRDGPLPAARPQRVGRRDAAVATRILHNFGREDEIDKDQVRRLVAALSRLLDPAEALAARGRASCRSPRRGPWAARTPWTGCGASCAWTTVIRRRPCHRPQAGPGHRAGPVRPGREPGAGRVVQARSRRLGPRRRAHRRPGRDTDDACYRAMDQLLAIGPDLAERRTTRSPTFSALK